MPLNTKRSNSIYIMDPLEHSTSNVSASPPQTASKRQRRPTKSKDRSSYKDLVEYHNYVVDVEDVLEDYLEAQKPKDRRPLVLDVDEGDWDQIPEYDHLGTIYRPGMSVKLKNGTFLNVHQIWMEFDHDFVIFRGRRLALTSRLRPILDEACAESQQELFLNLEVDKCSSIELGIQSTIDVPVQFIEKKVTINFSNCRSSCLVRPNVYWCRWKLVRYHENTKSGRRSVEVAIERLRFDEVDADHRIEDEMLRCAWRGYTEAGGSGSYQYTAVDGFCCGGGWSRGATMAGHIEVVRSFDKDPRACDTYRTNFPSTHCLNLDVFDYGMPERLAKDTRDLASQPEHVDIAHYSTPCQFFSPAHTREGVNDETNFAASFCLRPLLLKDKPRVVTFENTAGLERRHFPTLKAIFGQVTSLDYSLRFTCLNLADYGLPQSRKRLIMVAACPGEALPTFPTITHSENGESPGTQPWITMLETINYIPFEGWQNHRPKEMKRRLPPPKPRELAPTITCSGSEAVHPDGRLFTVCEYQLLQGFPLHHRFAHGLSRTQKLAQIGNAFPPLFVKKLLRHVRRQLQQSDGLEVFPDVDEFMTVEQLREQEVAQFLEDHERLPEGTRANLIDADFVDERDEDSYDEDEEDPNAQARGDMLATPEQWNWITTGPNSRRNSSQSKGSSASSLQTAGSALGLDRNRHDQPGLSLDYPIEL